MALTIKFKAERTKMAQKHLYRTGQAKLKRKGINIHIIRYARNGKTFYNVHILKGNAYDNVIVQTLAQVRKIINNVEKFGLKNTMEGF